MAASRELIVLVRRARRTRLARMLAGVVGAALGMCIVAGVRITITPAHAARSVTLAR